MAVVGISDPEEATSSCCVACAGTGVTWRSPGSQDGSGNKHCLLESGGGGRGFVAYLDGTVNVSRYFPFDPHKPLEMSAADD